MNSNDPGPIDYAQLAEKILQNPNGRSMFQTIIEETVEKNIREATIQAAAENYFKSPQCSISHPVQLAAENCLRSPAQQLAGIIAQAVQTAAENHFRMNPPRK